MSNVTGEIIIIKLFDVGRYIDLEQIIPIFPEIKVAKLKKTKDTPEYIYIPTPLKYKISKVVNDNDMPIKRATFLIKIYEDGVISITARIRFEDYPLENLHLIQKIKLSLPDLNFFVDEWITDHFNRIYKQIEEYIDKSAYDFVIPEQESYVCFCITNDVGDPSKFLEEHKKYLSILLMGEKIGTDLHSKQIKEILANPFSFYSNELIIFDFHSCLIFDPNIDYEDIVQILELSIYQLLELRTLDRLLDRKLDVAEDDLRKLGADIPAFKRLVWRKLNKKLGELYHLKFDMTFILENIENISKIIGDYYLAQIYKHMNEMFQVDKWSESVRNRLNILNEIYTTAKSTVNERILIMIELLLGVLFSLEFIFFIIGFF